MSTCIYMLCICILHRYTYNMLHTRYLYAYAIYDVCAIQYNMYYVLYTMNYIYICIERERDKPHMAYTEIWYTVSYYILWHKVYNMIFHTICFVLYTICRDRQWQKQQE